MLELVAALNSEIQRFAPMHVTEPESAIYRIYRDTRFSKDKKPYKTHVAAYFPRRGMDRHTASGYYVGVSHKEVAVGGGLYMPTPEVLRAVRNRIAERHAEFRKLLQSKPLGKLLGELHGEQLSRVPKGFPADHAAADLLRYKQFFFYIELPAGSRHFAYDARRDPEAIRNHGAAGRFFKRGVDRNPSEEDAGHPALNGLASLAGAWRLGSGSGSGGGSGGGSLHHRVSGELLL